MNESGSSRWGYVQVGYARHWVCHRIVVYPPGASADDARWLRVWRALPFVAIATVWTAALIASWMGRSGLAGMLSGMVVAFATVVVVGQRTHLVRTQTRTMEAWTGYGTDATARATQRSICELAAALRDADGRLASGAISPVEHEMVWARCYHEIPAARRRRLSAV